MKDERVHTSYSDTLVPFQRLYDDLRPKIFRYLTRMVGASDAEDLTQEVFVKVAQALPNFRGESQPSTWVYRIATNAAIDKIRGASTRHDAQQTPLDDTAEADAKEVWTGEEPPSLEQIAMRNDMIECFDRFVMNLPPNCRSSC